MKPPMLLTIAFSLLTLGSQAATVDDAAKTAADAVNAINAVNEQGKTPLMLAAARSSLDKIQKLIADGADVNAANNEGETALMCACENGGGGGSPGPPGSQGGCERPQRDGRDPAHTCQLRPLPPDP